MSAASVIQANSRHLPIADNTVDLVVTSPPYFALRSYQDGGQHYAGQIGDEPTPAEFVASLLEVTRECVRVLKPSGSLWVNLGDKYAGSRMDGSNDNGSHGTMVTKHRAIPLGQRQSNVADAGGVKPKSLIGIPWRYALACIDDLGLILRAEIIWSKPNGLPESVTDRVRRSHEQWFHFVLQPRYFSAVDEIREASSSAAHHERYAGRYGREDGRNGQSNICGVNPLGKLPCSVWTIPTEPLKVPAHLGIDHFACVDTDTEILTRRGWLRHDQVTTGDEAMGHDLDTGLARWTRVHDVHHYDYDGDLVSATARGLSMRLTPNHRTLTHAHTGRHRLRQPVQVIRADQVTKNHSIPRAVDWSGDDGAEKAIGTDYAALLGWVAAEGWYAKDGNSVYLSQSLSVNAAKVAEIDGIIERLGGGAYRTQRDRVWRGRPAIDVQWRLHPELAGDIRQAMPKKLLPMVDLPLTEAQAMLDAFVSGDGHRRPDGRQAIFQKERHNLDVLQALAVRLGYNTTLAQQPERWILYLNPPRPARLRRSDNTPLIGREHYTGTVWCVTTGTGTFVARRNGTVFVTGNSFPTEWPKRIIQGWSPAGVCVECGEGRRPATHKKPMEWRPGPKAGGYELAGTSRKVVSGTMLSAAETTIVGYACACPESTAPTTPALVLDPFGGTGTTAMVAKALGRHGISVDMSGDYSRLAAWRTNDRNQLAKVLGVDKAPPPHPDQLDLFSELPA